MCVARPSVRPSVRMPTARAPACLACARQMVHVCSGNASSVSDLLLHVLLVSSLLFSPCLVCLASHLIRSALGSPIFGLGILN